LWDVALKQQIYLGDEAFVERMQARVEPKRTATKEVPRAQRQRPRTLEQWMKQSGSREEALYNAYAQSGISMTKLAATLGLSVSRVSRLIAGEEAKDKT
jgi:ribosome-binding protein aMBF1 (putative translation factor)